MIMKRSNTGMSKRIVLYIFGVALIVSAILIVLKGFGILSAIPGFVIWALVLITIGIGILAGVKK